MTPRSALPITAGVVLLTILLSLSISQEIVTQPPPVETLDDLNALFADEPTYNEIQEAAMRFAEVHPDKIESWRQGAKFRAFLPRVSYRYNVYDDWTDEISTGSEDSISFEYSYDYEVMSSSEQGTNDGYGQAGSSGWPVPEWSMTQEYTNRSGQAASTRDAYGESGGTRDYIGTYEEDGNTKEWGVMLEWDLRDFLYSEEQTRISKEARELVELRQDVMEEVNTYFFDRRRSQIDMLFSPPTDTASRIDMQLQIARLTANIDALTGGFLSKRLAETKTAVQ
ncbi:MAG TPA: hypothetical protein PLI51_03980 [bacterium]|nr:hypothetical protein [bacterium]HPQ65868.1 hypothetical protein [bacterium]